MSFIKKLVHPETHYLSETELRELISVDLGVPVERVTIDVRKNPASPTVPLRVGAPGEAWLEITVKP